MPLAEENPAEKLVVIAGFNGLATARTWARHLLCHAPGCSAATYSWRHAKRAEMSIARSNGVTLIGHSLGGGFAQRIAERLPPGKIATLITVAPFAPRRIDTETVKNNVGFWLNIVSASRWHDPLIKLAGRGFLGWRDQGVIPAASENFTSRFPHQDFYKMMSERCGAVEHGRYRSAA